MASPTSCFMRFVDSAPWCIAPQTRGSSRWTPSPSAFASGHCSRVVNGVGGETRVGEHRLDVGTARDAGARSRREYWFSSKGRLAAEDRAEPIAVNSELIMASWGRRCPKRSQMEWRELAVRIPSAPRGLETARLGAVLRGGFLRWWVSVASRCRPRATPAHRSPRSLPC